MGPTFSKELLGEVGMFFCTWTGTWNLKAKYEDLPILFVIGMEIFGNICQFLPIFLVIGIKRIQKDHCVQNLQMPNCTSLLAEWVQNGVSWFKIAIISLKPHQNQIKHDNTSCSQYTLPYIGVIEVLRSLNCAARFPAAAIAKEQRDTG